MLWSSGIIDVIDIDIDSLPTLQAEQDSCLHSIPRLQSPNLAGNLILSAKPAVGVVWGLKHNGHPALRLQNHRKLSIGDVMVSEYTLSSIEG